MIRRFSSFRNRIRIPLALAGLALLTACQVGLPGGNGPRIGGGTVNVALLVPYGSASSGDDLVAQNLENAARLAASDVQDIDIRITVYPTAGNAEQAASATQQALSEGADVIVGPLRSDAASAAGLAARGRASVLSFSNNTEVAGGNVFVLGNTFSSTADRLVRYAAAQGRSRILVLHAQNLAGEVARDAILSAAARSGASIAGTVSYEFSANGVVEALPAVMAAVRDNGANAIFITSDTTGALPLFAQLLPENGLDTSAVQVIGMTRWDTPPQTLELRGLQGGWFALPDPNASASFNARYAAAYSAPPHVLAGLGYDAIQAVANAVRQSGGLGSNDLVSNAGIAGANGVFRLNPDGTNTRSLAVAEVIDAQVTIRDSAPASIGGPGF
ncbi:ABC transporter substrate-binding protein [Rhodobacterales bacterium HKCCE2091]|nr:ABC transporter substrate-binding protein [Rhodobacterales bacterium HKCCE2091]